MPAIEGSPGDNPCRGGLRLLRLGGGTIGVLFVVATDSSAPTHRLKISSISGTA
jgi:hypothetical protein